MSEISYKELETYLRNRENDPFSPVYLIYGEDLLTQNAFEALLEALLPVTERSLNYEPMDGSREPVHEVISRVNTYSLLPGQKVVALRDARIFYAGQDKNELLENAKKAFDDDNLKKAAGHLLSLMGANNLSYEDLDESGRKKSLGLDPASGPDDKWLDEVIVYCREHGLSVPAGRDDSRRLQEAVENGFPGNNHLIITTDMVDKRRGLYKSLNALGMIIDCSVPKGDRRSDQIAQEAVLVEKMNLILKAGKKSMGRAAYAALYEMTGFDLRTFCSNLEKLINWVGERGEITLEDVNSVLERTRKDPIYELTNALADRKTDAALFFLDSLLSSGMYPLQALAALINQIRKLLLAKGFVESSYGRDWQSACPYPVFQKRVMPAVTEYDRSLLDQLDRWQSMMNPEANSRKSGMPAKGKKKYFKTTTDLLLARNPKNPYPVYLLLKKSDQFSRDALVGAVEVLMDTDKKLKSGAQSPKLILEKAILSICE